MNATATSTSVQETAAAEIANLASPESRRSYEHVWRYFNVWLATQSLDPTAVRPRHVQAYASKLRDEGKKKGTIGRALSVLRTVYGALVRDELMATNPAREVRSPRVDGMPRAPWIADPAHIERLLNVPASTWTERRDRLVVRVTFGLGWRRSEISRIAIEDIDGEIITAPKIKGGKSLTVGLPGWVAEDIAEWCAFAGIDSGPLFPRSQSDGRPINGAIVYRVVRQMCERAGIEVVPPHGLRRSNITHAGIRGVSIKERQLSVGHSQSAVTERYDRARDAAKAKVGDVFRDLAGK